MGRTPCCEKLGLKKGTWTSEEDQKLLSYIQQHGHGNWRSLPAKAGLQRCGKSCRLRWINYLRPDIKRGNFSWQEEQTIIRLHALLGNRWSSIATHLPKRTDNEIKNHWNTHLKKRLHSMGIDPSTHKPKTNPFALGQHEDNANLRHIAQWESARLEAESRLIRESKLSVQSSTKKNGKVLPLPPMVLPCLDVLKAWQGTWKSCIANNNNNNNNEFFNPNIGTLESPTSTLQFPNNVIAAAAASSTTTFNATAGFVGHLSFSAITYVENPKASTKENGGNTDNVMLNDIVDYPIGGASYFEDSLKPAPCFMEGFVDAECGDGQSSDHVLMGSFHVNLDGSSGGDLEDNKKYWCNILNGEMINPEA